MTLLMHDCWGIDMNFAQLFASAAGYDIKTVSMIIRLTASLLIIVGSMLVMGAVSKNSFKESDTYLSQVATTGIKVIISISFGLIYLLMA